MQDRARHHYGKSDVLLALSAAGVEPGDTVFITTSLGMLGTAEGTSTLDDLNRLYFDCIMEVLGPEGTALAPAYSYTFGRSRASAPEVFDPETTRAEIGPFPNFFRCQPGVLRSLDPMMSICGVGPKAAALLGDIPPTSYGAGSVFARLTETDAKCCSIGLGPNWTPFIHHAEWLIQAPFRFDKLFTGRIRTRSGETLEHNSGWLYSVPILSEASRADAHLLGRLAAEAGIWRYAPLGRARVYVAGYRDYFQFAMKLLKDNPWIQAAGPAGSVVEMEEKRVGVQKFTLALARSNDLESRFAALEALPKDTVSDGYDAALNALIGLELPMKVSQTPTGRHHFDWIVPEKWVCRRAQLHNAAGEAVLDGIATPRHLFPYGLSFSGRVDAAHLRSHLQIEGAPPLFEQNFMLRDWAFTCNEEEAGRLAEGFYDIAIDCDRSYGVMKLADVTLRGRTDETLLVVSHLARTAGDRETLSGVLAAYEAVRRLAARGPFPRSLIFVIAPGTVGLAAWMDLNRSRLPNIAAALTVRSLAGADSLALQRPPIGDGSAGEALGAAIEAAFPKLTVAPPCTLWNDYARGGNPIAAADPLWGSVPMASLGSAGETQGSSTKLWVIAEMLEAALARALELGS